MVQISALDAVLTIQKRTRLSRENAQRVLVASLQQGWLIAYAESWWHSVSVGTHYHDAADDESAIPSGFWRMLHSENTSIEDGDLTSVDIADYSKSRFEKIDVVRGWDLLENPRFARWAHLPDFGDTAAYVREQALGVSVSAVDVDRIISRGGFATAIKRLSVARARLPGPTPSLELERLKADLVVLALSNPDRVRTALAEAALPALLLGTTYDVDPNAITKFADEVMRSWHAARGKLSPAD